MLVSIDRVKTRSRLLKRINVHLLIAVVVAAPFALLGINNNALAQEATITTSADSHGRVFFGEGFLQVVVTDPDADDNDLQESIVVEIEANAEFGPDSSGTFTIPETSETSGMFEFFMAHSLADDVTLNALNGMNDNGDPVEYTGAGTGPSPVIRFGSGEELPVTTGLFEDVSFDLTVGNTAITVDYEESSGELTLDRDTYGSDSIVYLAIIDQDANKNPTAPDSFTSSPLQLNGILFDIEGASFADSVVFEETGDNTARFEASLQLSSVESPGPQELVFTAEAVELTLNDLANYDVPDSTVNDSTDTSSRSFDIDDVDGELDDTGTLTFGSELKLTLRDNDQNKDSQDDETLDDAVTVSVDNAGGDVEFIDMEETEDNTGVFIIDLSDNELPITFLPDGAEPVINNARLELRQSDITEDIVIEYTDPRDDDSLPGSVTSSFTVEMTLATGSVELPDTAGIDEKFPLTITDADLNDNVRMADSYTFVLDGSGPYPLMRGGATIGNLAQIEIEIEGADLDFGIPITYTLVEDGSSSGIFKTELDLADIISSSGVDVEDGDELQITYIDLMGEPTSQSSDTLLIVLPPQSPAEAIADLVDRADDLNIRHAPLKQAAKLLSDDNPRNDKGACGKLNAFINHVNSQSGKKLTEEDAKELVDRATDILHQIGCKGKSA